MNIFMKVCLTLMLVVGMTQGLFAQEADEEQYAYGIIKEVMVNSLVLVEWDSVEEKDNEVVYSISEDVEFENVDEERGLLAGDSVDVFFMVNDDVKQATSIVLYTDEEVAEDDEEGMEKSLEMMEDDLELMPVEQAYDAEDELEMIPAEDIENNGIGLDY